MKTPKPGSSEDEFNAEIVCWLRRNAVCVRCGSRLEGATVYVSIHADEFGTACAGQGQVVRAIIPFCPQCEQTPTSETCIHKPLLLGRVENVTPA